MYNDFSTTLASLRKERGLSQKKVAADLGVSQALLSHYEKGIRECGLKFVASAADYYGVSCDYLLGRTPLRNGTAFFSTNTEDFGNYRTRAEDEIEYNKKTIINSINIIFCMLEKINSKPLSKEITSILSSAIYKVLVIFRTASPQLQKDIFLIDANKFDAEINIKAILNEAKAKFLLSGGQINESPGIKDEELPVLTKEQLSEEYGKLSDSLFSVVEQAEKDILNVKLSHK